MDAVGADEDVEPRPASVVEDRGGVLDADETLAVLDRDALSYGLVVECAVEVGAAHHEEGPASDRTGSSMRLRLATVITIRELGCATDFTASAVPMISSAAMPLGARARVPPMPSAGVGYAS